MNRWIVLFVSLFTVYGGEVRAERVVIPSDEDLLSSADYCVVGTLTKDLSLRVDTKVFGNITNETLNLPTFLNEKTYKPGLVYVVYLVQEGGEIRTVTLGVREVRDGDVITSSLMQKGWFAEVKKNKVPFPAGLEQYVAEVKKREEVVRATRHENQDEALEKFISGQLYTEKQWNAVHDILNGVLHSVHADDKTTLDRMASFVRERPKSIDMHARKTFVSVIARKNYRLGFDSIRLEASRNSRDGQNWASERAAIHALGRIGEKGDIELLRKIILTQGERLHGTLLRAAFPAFATLVIRYCSGEPALLAREIKWVEDHRFPWFKEALLVFKKKNIKSTEPNDALDKK